MDDDKKTVSAKDLVKASARVIKKFGVAALDGYDGVSGKYPKKNADERMAAAPDYIKKRLAEVEAAGRK